MCSLPDLRIEESDARRKDIVRLQSSLDKKSKTFDNNMQMKELEPYYEWIQLIKKEYRDAAESHAHHAYYTAYIISAKNDDFARAFVFHTRSFRAALLSRSKVGHMVLKGLGAGNFEKRLWRPEVWDTPRAVS